MHFKKLIAAAALAVAGIAGSATAANAAPIAATSASASVLTVSFAASAQDRRYRDNDRRWDRGHRRGWDRGRYNRGRGYNRGRVCWTEYRRYQGRVTVCRRRR